MNREPPWDFESDKGWDLEPDRRELIADTPCPCGKPVVKAETRSDMLGGGNNVYLRNYHSRVDYCEFRRRF